MGWPCRFAIRHEGLALFPSFNRSSFNLSLCLGYDACMGKGSHCHRFASLLRPRCRYPANAQPEIMVAIAAAAASLHCSIAMIGVTSVGIVNARHVWAPRRSWIERRVRDSCSTALMAKRCGTKRWVLRRESGHVLRRRRRRCGGRPVVTSENTSETAGPAGGIVLVNFGFAYQSDPITSFEARVPRAPQSPNGLVRPAAKPPVALDT
ncbi:hypothetical protein Rcae01_06429 [Novipirellula caenicola]|uniref:Uncharacterized protein n=1 Tax=Novipirellula caenicola TaxID=1536901 RepID=A0ABP9W0L4_9BACT